ncbi:MAG: zinc ribbon domain-containing protein [Coriobacteriia bacterium]|nr:zinc ribbon domain-containing protein [Coriobacteriia bacterium]
MFGLGPGETVIIIILIIVLFVIFGPKQLPKLGKMFGKTMKSVRTGLDEMNAEMKTESASEPTESDAAETSDKPAASVPLVCPKCGTTAKPGTKFCPECGTELKVPEPVAAADAPSACPKCGTIVAPGTKFCPECGEKF